MEGILSLTYGAAPHLKITIFTLFCVIFSLPGKYNVLTCCLLPFQLVFIVCFNLVLEIAVWN